MSHQLDAGVGTVTTVAVLASTGRGGARRQSDPAADLPPSTRPLDSMLRKVVG